MEASSATGGSQTTLSSSVQLSHKYVIIRDNFYKNNLFNDWIFTSFLFYFSFMHEISAFQLNSGLQKSILCSSRVRNSQRTAAVVVDVKSCARVVA